MFKKRQRYLFSLDLTLHLEEKRFLVLVHFLNNLYVTYLNQNDF